MAITINGSGSISGISAGGISDAGAIADSAMGAGAVLQVVNFVLTVGSTQTSSSTYSDTGLTASITPSSASNKILVIIVHNGVYKNTTNTWANFRWARNSTDMGAFAEVNGYDNGTNDNNVGAVAMTYLDSPNTTSSVTYKTQFNNHGSTGNAGFNRNGSNSYITLMEIAG